MGGGLQSRKVNDTFIMNASGRSQVCCASCGEQNGSRPYALVPTPISKGWAPEIRARVLAGEVADTKRKQSRHLSRGRLRSGQHRKEGCRLTHGPGLVRHTQAWYASPYEAGRGWLHKEGEQGGRSVRRVGHVARRPAPIGTDLCS